jgi:dTDP-4-amino-4,6-dideoxygalactose transaminase
VDDMTERIHLSAPDITELEERYVLAALRSGWVAPQGPDLVAFESEVADRVGVGHAVAVSSGTAGLHLAMLALGVRPGDAVVVPTLTFAATANAAVYAGASPVFIDSDPATGCADPDLLADALTRLRFEGRWVGAVVPVDLLGRCADYAALLPVCAAYGVPAVEDAAEALGSTYGGRAAGSFGRVGVLSFNGNKILTTSGGGMVLSDDSALVDRCRHLATQARRPVAHYEHDEVGYNYRLSNVLAALGRAQLARLDEMVARRRALRERYAKLFAGWDGVTLLGDDPGGGSGGTGSNCWLTALVVDPDRAGWRAAELAASLAGRDIETRPLFKPLHLQRAYAGATAVLTGAAERLYATGLVLPSGSVLDDAQRDRVTNVIDDFLRSQGRA